MSRCEVKDFVDLYYLLVEKNFSIYDLIIGLRYKFNRKADPYDVADSMLQVNQFSTLPNMIRPLKLQALKDYFNNQAKTLGSMSVE